MLQRKGPKDGHHLAKFVVVGHVIPTTEATDHKGEPICTHKRRMGMEHAHDWPTPHPHSLGSRGAK